ncbi:MAG: DUF1214 domain-containing protein [Acidimicrobiia bacterium]
MSDIDRGSIERMRTAWHAYCDALKSEGDRLLDIATGTADVTADAAADAHVTVDNEQELAEALRAIGRLGMMALMHRFDFNDPDFPVFFRALDDRFKYAGPDIHITYLNAAVRGTGVYRITGNHFGRELNLGALWSSAIDKADDGSFEIIASAEPRETKDANWIKLDPSHVSGATVPAMYPMAQGGLGGRTYYWDPDDGLPLGQFHIERIDDGAPPYPEPLSPARLSTQIDSATELFRAMAYWWMQRAERIRQENAPNVVGPPGTRPPGVPGFNPPDNSPLNYGVCCWELDEGEALVIETDLPEARYWSFQTYNPWWESPDNQYRQTSIGHTQAHLDTDGRFRAVVSHADPGVPNWLDTCGNRRGFMFYRWLYPTTAMPTPVAVKVPVATVRDHLPADHPVTSRAQRRDALAIRRRWIASRFQR